MLSKNKLAWCLIFAGALLLAYPKASEKHESIMQEKLLYEWQEAVITQTTKQSTKNEEEDSKSHLLPPQLPKDDAQKQEKAEPDKVFEGVEGILAIEKISLKVPILTNATSQNLKVSVASIENTGSAGKPGNYAIAGHRSKAWGKNFNRLDELEAGDTVEVVTTQAAFKYTVEQKLFVRPDEVWVLNGNGKDCEITLVTCHPVIDPTCRLVIKGRIKKE
ncbi:MAG: class D sortase [Clostridia bacterium]|nr:class D sortase [Clostridia bacterium]